MTNYRAHLKNPLLRENILSPFPPAYNLYYVWWIKEKMTFIE